MLTDNVSDFVLIILKGGGQLAWEEVPWETVKVLLGLDIYHFNSA